MYNIDYAFQYSSSSKLILNIEGKSLANVYALHVLEILHCIKVTCNMSWVVTDLFFFILYI